MERIVTMSLLGLVMLVAILGLMNLDTGPGEAIRIEQAPIQEPSFDHTEQINPDMMRPVLRDNELITANFNNHDWRLYTDGRSEFWARPAK